MRLAPLGLCPMLVALRAFAADAPPPAHAPPAAEAPGAAQQDAPDPNRARREALLDVAFAALVAGHLDQAERAFEEAAALPGDPARAAVAASFAERTRRLRASPVRAARAPGGALPPEAPDDGSETARVAFVATTTALGLGLYGWTVPGALGLKAGESTRTFIGFYMLTVGASFAAPFLATRNAQVTPAQANLAFYGGTRGLVHGLLLTSVLAGDVSPEQTYRLWAGSLLVGSTGELALGYWLGGRGGLTAGQARTIAVGGDFGLAYGLGAGVLLGLHHDNRGADAQARGIGVAGLLGSAAGLGGGYLLAANRDNTWGDGEVLRAAGLVGVWLGLTGNVLLDWDPDDDEKKFFVTLMAGGALGLWAGDRMVRPTNFTVARSLLVDLATVAGALGAAGLAYLVSSAPSGNEEKGFLASSAVGGVLGFGLSYAALRDDGAAAPIHTGASPGVAVLPLLGAGAARGVAVAGAF